MAFRFNPCSPCCTQNTGCCAYSGPLWAVGTIEGYTDNPVIVPLIMESGSDGRVLWAGVPINAGMVGPGFYDYTTQTQAPPALFPFANYFVESLEMILDCSVNPSGGMQPSLQVGHCNTIVDNTVWPQTPYRCTPFNVSFSGSLDPMTFRQIPFDLSESENQDSGPIGFSFNIISSGISAQIPRCCNDISNELNFIYWPATQLQVFNTQDVLGQILYDPNYYTQGTMSYGPIVLDGYNYGSGWLSQPVEIQTLVNSGVFEPVQVTITGTIKVGLLNKCGEGFPVLDGAPVFTNGYYPFIIASGAGAITQFIGFGFPSTPLNTGVMPIEPNLSNQDCRACAQCPPWWSWRQQQAANLALVGGGLIDSLVVWDGDPNTIPGCMCNGAGLPIGLMASIPNLLNASGTGGGSYGHVYPPNPVTVDLKPTRWGGFEGVGITVVSGSHFAFDYWYIKAGILPVYLAAVQKTGVATGFVYVLSNEFSVSEANSTYVQNGIYTPVSFGANVDINTAAPANCDPFYIDSGDVIVMES